jgi:homogentisate phytyltransferase/homogentisate geranylgeranyltransferase
VSRSPLAARASLGRPRTASSAGALGVLWRFGRPHTLIGTTAGIAGIYVIAVSVLAGGDLAAAPGNLFWVLVAGWCVNVFIVGVNQLTDVEIDRVNKPELPIAAGDLSPTAARWIVGVSAVVPVVLALTQGWVELVSVGAALTIGAAYSLPPLRLKRLPVVAALSITVVRTLVLNLGVWVHFRDVLGGSGVSGGVWALIAVTLPFSLAIAILKDLPDVEGDRRYGIATFSVRLGPQPVLAAGLALLTAAELGMAVAGAARLDGANRAVLVGGQLGALALLWWWASRIDLSDRASLARFYQGVWRLFFLEYLIVPLAYLVAS